MAAQGRAPVMDSRGEITGFKSRPGAPLSPLDTMHGMGIGGNDPAAQQIGTDAHKKAWGDWFHSGGSTSELSSTKIPIKSAFAPDPNDDSGMPALNPHVDPVGASIANNSNWLRSNGIAFPPPTSPLPSLAPPSRVALQFPNGVNPRATGAESASTWAGIQTGNARLYAPADTQQSSFAPKTNWNRTGWNGPTQPVATGAFTTPYGSASVNFGASNPALPASNTRWGWNATA